MATKEHFRADRATADRQPATERHATAERRGAPERKAAVEPVAAPELAPEPVTPEQRWLVQNTWDKIVPMAPHVAELFFDRLFELDPFLEDLFPADLSELGAEWARALALSASRLEEPSSVAPCLEALSRRHVDIGVRPGHYVTMGNALLWTLEQSLAEDFTPRVKEAWSAAYRVLSALLIQADAAAVLGKAFHRESPRPEVYCGEGPRPEEPGSGLLSLDAVSLSARRAG